MEVKYDYLLSATKGKSNDLVANRSTYREAMGNLDKEFGNIHMIMGLLIDDVRSLSVVRKGDFKGFERLAYEARAFKDRLEEMGLADEAENTYILKELESKLYGDDFQKWLESLGKNFDNRKVDDFVQWLEYQRNVRRILNSATSKTMYVTDSMAEKLKRVNINAAGHKEICVVCSNGQHDVEACSVFINWDINKKWDFVKENR